MNPLMLATASHIVEMPCLLTCSLGCSISVVAGDKVMVTEENLLKAGFASIHFDKLDETVSGQALLSGKLYEAKVSRYPHVLSPQVYPCSKCRPGPLPSWDRGCC